MVEPGDWTGVSLDGLDTDFVGNGVNTCFEDGVFAFGRYSKQDRLRIAWKAI